MATIPATPLKTSSGFFGKLWTSIKGALGWTRTYAVKHKIITGIIVLALIGGGYYAYTAVAAGNSSTEYMLASVTKGPLQVTVTESGQVDSKDTLSVTPQGGASGQITYIGVTPGESVRAGTVIARLDATTAAQAVTSARQNLESAQISYQQALTSSQTSDTNDQTAVATAETNEAADIATTYSNLPAVMQGLDSTLHNISTIPDYNALENVDAYDTLVGTAEAHADHDKVVASDAAAVTAYQNALADYTSANPATLTPAQLQQLAQTSIQMTVTVNQALQDTLTYLNYVNDQLESSRSTIATQIPTQITSLNTYESTVTTDDQNITNANSSLTNAQQTLAEDTQSLGDSSSVPLTVQSAELNVQKAQLALQQAETTEADYDIVAPFAGTIATVPVNQYDEASSGTTIATLITNVDYVDVSLNETDAASVQLGQPVSMTFNAIPNLTLTGKIAEIDPVGTVTSGVVTYDVQISFDNEDPRVKPGMTVTAVITTASVASAIQVPSSAVTTANGVSYVQVATLKNATSTLAAAGGAGFTGARRTRTASSTASGAGEFTAGGAGAFSTTSTTTAAFAARFAGMSRTLTVAQSAVTIKKVPVTIGLSTDTMTQIVSGLQPGQFVVSSTITKASTTQKSSAASATSLLGGSARGGFSGGAGGGGFGGGGAARTTTATAGRGG
jgi:HlyD family secretion protein